MKKEQIMAKLQNGDVIEIRYKNGNREIGYFLTQSEEFITISNNDMNIGKHSFIGQIYTQFLFLNLKNI